MINQIMYFDFNFFNSQTKKSMKKKIKLVISMFFLSFFSEELKSIY